MPRNTLERHRIANTNWIPWLAEGLDFKLLWADLETDRCSVIVRIKGNSQLAAHKHIGSVEVLVLSGVMYYDDEPEYLYSPGSYLFENEGAEHSAVFPYDAEIFAHLTGPISGVDLLGETVTVDAQWHCDQWAASGQELGICEPAPQQGDS